MSAGQNEVSLLTAPGVAALAVVRLRGDAVKAFLTAHLDKPAQPGRCVHARLRDGDQLIDDPVVVLHADSSTVDLNLHGGTHIVTRCIELAQREGFSRVEFIHDSADELEREMHEAIPQARTELGLRLLLDQPRLWRDNPPNQTGAAAMLQDHALHWLLHPPNIAIVGIPNAGKSTLANALFGQDKSITAPLAGTTRDWVGDFANLDGLPVFLIDTPGLRQTIDPIESAAIAGSAPQIAAADLVLLVLDPTQPETMQNQLLLKHPAALPVANKSDCRPIWKSDALAVSAATGAGLAELRIAIKARFLGDKLFADLPRWWTRRQRDILLQLAQPPVAR